MFTLIDNLPLGGRGTAVAVDEETPNKKLTSQIINSNLIQTRYNQ